MARLQQACIAGVIIRAVYVGKRAHIAIWLLGPSLRRMPRSAALVLTEERCANFASSCVCDELDECRLCGNV